MKTLLQPGEDVRRTSGLVAVLTALLVIALGAVYLSVGLAMIGAPSAMAAETVVVARTPAPVASPAVKAAATPIAPRPVAAFLVNLNTADARAGDPRLAGGEELPEPRRPDESEGDRREVLREDEAVLVRGRARGSGNDSSELKPGANWRRAPWRSPPLFRASTRA